MEGHVVKISWTTFSPIIGWALALISSLYASSIIACSSFVLCMAPAFMFLAILFSGLVILGLTLSKLIRSRTIDFRLSLSNNGSTKEFVFQDTRNGKSFSFRPLNVSLSRLPYPFALGLFIRSGLLTGYLLEVNGSSELDELISEFHPNSESNSSIQIVGHTINLIELFAFELIPGAILFTAILSNASLILVLADLIFVLGIAIFFALPYFFHAILSSEYLLQTKGQQILAEIIQPNRFERWFRPRFYIFDFDRIQTRRSKIVFMSARAVLNTKDPKVSDFLLRARQGKV